MYGTPYIFHFVHPLVKTAEIMVQRVNFEQNLKNIRPPTVFDNFVVEESWSKNLRLKMERLLGSKEEYLKTGIAQP